jgi:hypothetical protein
MEKVKFMGFVVAAAIDVQGNVAAHKCFESRLINKVLKYLQRQKANVKTKRFYLVADNLSVQKRNLVKKYCSDNNFI